MSGAVMDCFWKKSIIWFSINFLPGANLFKIANRVHNSCLANANTACSHISLQFQPSIPPVLYWTGRQFRRILFPKSRLQFGGKYKIIVKNCEDISSLLSDYSVFQLWALREAVQMNYQMQSQEFYMCSGFKNCLDIKTSDILLHTQSSFGLCCRKFNFHLLSCPSEGIVEFLRMSKKRWEVFVGMLRQLPPPTSSG